MASYSAIPMSKINTMKIVKEMPSIAIAPTAVIIPLMSITYHSGYFTRRATIIAMIATDKQNAKEQDQIKWVARIHESNLTCSHKRTGNPKSQHIYQYKQPTHEDKR